MVKVKGVSFMLDGGVLVSDSQQHRMSCLFHDVRKLGFLHHFGIRDPRLNRELSRGAARDRGRGEGM